MTDVSQPQNEGGVRIPPELVALATSTLDQVDQPAWGAPPEGVSALIHRAYALRTIPLAHLRVDDLRLLISQDVARQTLIPVALGMLRHRPLLEGDYYPGDLLMAVMRAPDSYWAEHPDQRALLREALSRLDRDDPEYPAFEDSEFEKAVARHRAGS